MTSTSQSSSVATTAERAVEFASVLDELVPRWAPPDEPPPRAGALGYLPGLDGLRALSALAVVAYHLEYSWSAGGYLGVEVFFVLSGFLITRLMLDEHRRTGAVDRVRFWGRRARRLLPAIVVLVVGVCVYGALVLPEGDVSSYRGDAIASLFYVQNWHAILADQPYFQFFGRPSPLTHVWSLAIEEQFYLVWPLLLPWAVGRFGRRRTVVGVLVLAGASALAMAATADISAPERAYYGTDTRAFGILLGGALAFGWVPERSRRTIVRPARWTIDALGVAALSALVWQFVHRSEFDPWTYPQGFLLVDACTLVLLVAVTHPAGRLGRLVGSRWPAALGRRSYSLYLWHWPVLVFTRPGIDWGLEGWSATAARLAIIAALTEISYRFVEQPFRDGRVSRWAGRLSSRIGVILARRLAVAATVVSLIVFLSFLSSAPSPAQEVETARAPVADSPVATAPSTTSDRAATTSRDGDTPAVTQPRPTTSTTTTTAAPRPAPRTGPAEVTIIGESVTLGADDVLRGHWGTRVQIDAVEGRQAGDAIGRLEQIADEGILTDTVILHIGNNGAIPAGGFERVAAAAGPDRQVVLVTVRVPRRWETQVNTEVERAAEQFDNVEVADWNAIANSEEGLLVDDGVHLSKRGKQRYAEMLIWFRP